MLPRLGPIPADWRGPERTFRRLRVVESRRLVARSLTPSPTQKLPLIGFKSHPRNQILKARAIGPFVSARAPCSNHLVVQSDPEVMSGTPVFVGTRAPF